MRTAGIVCVLLGTALIAVAFEGDRWDKFSTGAAAVGEAETTFVSPTECHNAHAVYRTDVKNDHELPPDHIPAANHVYPSDMAKWPVPEGKYTRQTPRSGREKEWFELTGQVVLAKCEEDGDIHIQLVDPDGKGKVNVVVEIPVKQYVEESPWDEIRTKVFSWSTAKFPFKTKGSHPLTLHKQPIIIVVGHAFWDGMHHLKDGKPNRRKDGDVAVWEIHPVMELYVRTKESLGLK
jgi:hypothetical protein